MEIGPDSFDAARKNGGWRVQSWARSPKAD